MVPSLREFRFAVSLIKWFGFIPGDSISIIIVNLLARTATSVCANYRAAQSGKSRLDCIRNPGLLRKKLMNVAIGLKCFMNAASPVSPAWSYRCRSLKK
jgi:hypothetical protein